jgi:hypothetical protein
LIHTPYVDETKEDTKTTAMTASNA